MVCVIILQNGVSVAERGIFAMTVKKNQTVRLTITDVNNKGFGVARLDGDGRVVFVANAVTGEEISAKIIKVASDYLVARCEECHSVLQGPFPAQGWNPGLLHCRHMFKNGQLRQIIHEVTCHMRLSFWDVLVIIISMECICLQTCPFTSELRSCFHLN